METNTQNSGVGGQNSGVGIQGLVDSTQATVPSTETAPVATGSAASETPTSVNTPEAAPESALQKAEHVVVEKTKEYAPVVRDFGVKWGKKGWSALRENSKVWFAKLDAKMDEIVEGMNGKK